jgi:hypothetical protein
MQGKVMSEIDWSSLTDAGGSAETIPDLLAQLEADDPDSQREALDELYDRLLDDGFAFDATVAALPALMAAVPRLRRASDRVTALTFLAEVAAGDGDTARSSMTPLRRPAPWDDSVSSQCWRAIEDNLHELTASLADRSVAVRAAAVALMTHVPPRSPESLAARLEDPEPMVRGLTAIALAKRAPLSKDGVGLEAIRQPRRRRDALERALFASAAAILERSTERARALLASLPADAGTVQHFPWFGGDVHLWLVTLLASLPFGSFAEEMLPRLRPLVSRRKRPWDLSRVLELTARTLFEPIDVDAQRGSWLPRTCAELPKPQREFLLLVSRLVGPREESWPYVQLSEFLVRCGLPVGKSELREASYARNLRAFVEPGAREPYFLPLRGSDGIRAVEMPVFAWARRSSLGLAPATDFAAALATFSARQLVDVAVVLGWAPLDLRGTPGFDDTIRYGVSLSALRAARGVERAVQARLAEVGRQVESFALVLFALERGVFPEAEGEHFARYVAVESSETTREMLRAALKSVDAATRDRLVGALPFEVVAGPDQHPTLSRWEVVDLAADRTAAAQEVVAAVRNLTERADPPGAQEHRVASAIDSLLPESALAIRDALAGDARPWDDFLRRYLR